MTRHTDPIRRKFLKILAATGAAAGAGGVLGRVAGAHERKGKRKERDKEKEKKKEGRRDLLDLTATEAVAALRAGDITAERYAGVLIRRAKSLGFLNAFVTLNPGRVLKAARAADKARASGADLGPLHGLPVALKDLLNTADEPTSAGTPGLAGNIPKAGNAALVDILQGAGAINFGKANMHEMSFGATSVNPFTGSVGNPYDPTRIAGGSSGGPAASVAARMVAASIGGDTAGSIRIPASLSGVCGLRPTTGNWPGDTTTVVPISNTRDTLGPLARSCADLELLDRVVTGAPEIDDEDDDLLEGLRLGMVPHFFSDLDAGVEAAILSALDDLTAAGVVLVEADIPNLVELTGAASFNVMLFEVLPNVTAYLDANTMKSDGMPITLNELVEQMASPDVKGLFESLIPAFGGAPVPEAAYRDALDTREQLRDAYRQHFADNNLDALVFPSTVVRATPIDNPSSIIELIHNTDSGSLAGLPGTAQPIGLSDGLPVSLGLDGLPGSDRSILAMAVAMERDIFGRLEAPDL